MTMHIRDILTDMFGPEVGIGVEHVGEEGGLTADEAASVSRAIPKRVAEFAAGRRAAHNALAAIGSSDRNLPMGEDRAPVWPQGIVGAITHDTGLALAVAARRSTIEALGLDLTEAAPLPEGTRTQILRHPREEKLGDLEARAVFSAKETLFKTLAPQVGFVFGFSAAEVEIDLSRGQFEARLSQPLGKFGVGQIWQGALAIEGDRLLTGLIIREAQSRVPTPVLW